MKCINGLHLTLFSHRGGALFLEMEVLPAFLLAPHPQANFGCDSKKQWKCINGLHLTLCSNRWRGALFLEMEILPTCLLAPHPHENFIFVLKH